MIDPLRDFPFVRDGYRRGLSLGRAEGKAEGKAEGMARSVLTLLATRGVRLSRSRRARILACTDADMLDRWLRNAISAASADEVFVVL